MVYVQVHVLTVQPEPWDGGGWGGVVKSQKLCSHPSPVYGQIRSRYTLTANQYHGMGGGCNRIAD